MIIYQGDKIVVESKFQFDATKVDAVKEEGADYIIYLELKNSDTVEPFKLTINLQSGIYNFNQPYAESDKDMLYHAGIRVLALPQYPRTIPFRKFVYPEAIYDEARPLTVDDAVAIVTFPLDGHTITYNRKDLKMAGLRLVQALMDK